MNYWKTLRKSGDKTIVVKEGVTEIPAKAFKRLDAEEVVLPESLRTIGEKAFMESKIQKITIPKSVLQIKSYAFCGCEQLTSIHIPDSVIEIGGYVFADCINLTSINLPINLTVINSGMFVNVPIENIGIPDGVTHIGNHVFNSTNLTHITIPEGVVQIGNGAFKNTKIQSFLIPKSVKELEEEALSSVNLEKVTFLGNTKVERMSLERIGVEKQCFKELSISSESLENFYKEGWISRVTERLQIGDSIIQGDVLKNFPCLQDLDLFRELLNILSLNEFFDALNAIRVHFMFSKPTPLVNAIASYLTISKDTEL